MRSVQVSSPVLSTVASAEIDLSGVCLMFITLAITGTCTATVQYQVAPGVWTTLAPFGSVSSTTSNEQLYAVGRVRLVVESVSGGSAQLEVSGVRG